MLISRFQTNENPFLSVGCFIDGKHYNHNDVIERHDCMVFICSDGEKLPQIAHAYMDYCDIVDPKAKCQVSDLAQFDLTTELQWSEKNCLRYRL